MPEGSFLGRVRIVPVEEEKTFGRKHGLQGFGKDIRFQEERDRSAAVGKIGTESVDSNLLQAFRKNNLGKGRSRGKGTIPYFRNAVPEINLLQILRPVESICSDIREGGREGDDFQMGKLLEGERTDLGNPFGKDKDIRNGTGIEDDLIALPVQNKQSPFRTEIGTVLADNDIGDHGKVILPKACKGLQGSRKDKGRKETASLYGGEREAGHSFGDIQIPDSGIHKSMLPDLRKGAGKVNLFYQGQTKSVVGKFTDRFPLHGRRNLNPIYRSSGITLHVIIAERIIVLDFHTIF